MRTYIIIAIILQGVWLTIVCLPINKVHVIAVFISSKQRLDVVNCPFVIYVWVSKGVLKMIIVSPQTFEPILGILIKCYSLLIKCVSRTSGRSDFTNSLLLILEISVLE